MDLSISSNFNRDAQSKTNAATVKGVKKQNKESNREADLSNFKNVEIGKRKKMKSRNSTVPPTSIYQKDLDVWLENCLKDVAAPQLSLSSEFLEYNPSSFHSLKKSQQVVNPNSQELAQNLKNFLNYGNKIPKNSHLQYESSVEFASLPPLINLGTNRDNSTNHILPDGNESNKRSFRFSDPCLIGDGPSDQESKISGKEILDPPNLDNKFLSTILEQINLLHETNSKICRNLHETKVEIEALKHAPNWGLRHRRDSLSGLSTHSQPMGLVFGTQSPAPTYNSGVYAPGMMTDLIREVKEAARIREEALLNRVKALVEERSWSVGEGNFKILRDVEEMKVQIQHLRNDKKEANKRIVQLETENKCIRSILASIFKNHTQSEVIQESPHLNSNRLRKNSGFNINYGTINQDEEVCRMTPNDKNIVHNKSSSSDAVNVGSYIDQNSFLNLDGNCSSYRIDNLYPTPESEQIVVDGEQALQMEKDTLDLRRELQEALASKKHAENRIIALENMLKHLQIKDNHPSECNTTSLNGFVTHSELRHSGRSSVQGLSSKLSLAGPITDL